jgi:hypothetical protein
MRLKPTLKGLVYFIGGGLLSLVVLGFAIYISNRNLPTGPDVKDRLTALDKVRLEETYHLKATLGEAVWSGWGKMETPVLLWHQGNNFLIGVENPPPGWDRVSGDEYQGAPYFSNPGYDPENFATYIDGRWIASMGTKGETDQFMQDMFRKVIPDPIENFFPYRLLILNTEIQISGVLHESFHVYQAIQSPGNFERTQTAYENSDRYWDIDEGMESAWAEEMDLLIDAATSQEEKEIRSLTRQFLKARDMRRADHNLTPDLVSFETGTEWLEGLTKYVELSIWEAAFNSTYYEPIPAIETDPDFKDYQTFNQRWKQEISQARRQATIQGDVRFYYTGMLQARLLDKLSPGWQSAAMEDGVSLEDLIRQAISP